MGFLEKFRNPSLEIMTLFPRHVTSSTHDVDLKGNNFRRTIHPQRLIVVGFIFSELETGGFRSKLYVKLNVTALVTVNFNFSVCI